MYVYCRCYDIHRCVECQAYKSGELGEGECSKKCTQFATEVVDKLVGQSDGRVKSCRVPDSSGCTIVYQYELDDKGGIFAVKAERKKQCSDVDIIGKNRPTLGAKIINKLIIHFLLAIILYIVVSIVLAGIVLLVVWKTFTIIHDRREYAKFEDERVHARWNSGENPLYRKATSEFRNPLYNS